jgi:hypothetical protein
LEKNYFSSHKLPKQQSTSFWSQGILGVNIQLFQKNKIRGLIFEHFWNPSGYKECHNRTVNSQLVSSLAFVLSSGFVSSQAILQYTKQPFKR